MAEITREEFKKIYDEKFLPLLLDLEQERIKTLNKGRNAMIITFLCLFVIGLVMFFYYNLDFIVVVSSALFLSLIPYLFITSYIYPKMKEKLVPKVLELYGDLYLTPYKSIISLSDIKKYGLFPKAVSMVTDDVIEGRAKGSNFVIAEIALTHTESSNNESRMAIDFKGLVIKIQMNKNFTGQTVVGAKGNVSKKTGFDIVELESVDFMQVRDVFSNNQIEARYLLTTAFMVRLEDLYKKFYSGRLEAEAKTKGTISTTYTILENMAGSVNSSVVSAMFDGGYVYIFIPTIENFFEIPIDTLLNPDIYFRIYNELDSILSVVEHLNLDSKTGL